jgi:hypothetical protein
MPGLQPSGTDSAWPVVSSRQPFVQQNLLMAEPFQVFWTPYDPLDLASTSLDPLGFARGYLALADRLLPSFTTVTTVPRYVSMLCAALKLAQTQVPTQAGLAPSKLRRARLKLVKSYERAWALACGLAARVEEVGPKAVGGLRGIRYVKRRLETLSGREKYVQTDSFNLLSNQVRYGGIGIYSTFLEECHLASMPSLTLRPLGEELAEAFPQPAHALKVYDEEDRLSLDMLQAWGWRAHLGAFTEREAQVLAKALRGGEEAELADHVRWTALRMLAQLGPADDYDEGHLLGLWARAIADARFRDLQAPAECAAQLQAVLHILEPFERFYQAMLFLFEHLRAVASAEGRAVLGDVARAPVVVDADKSVRENGEALCASLPAAGGISPITAQDVGGVLRESDVLALVQEAAGTRDPVAMTRIILRRHEQVQSGRFDRGMPKAPWMRLSGDEESAYLTMQRYELHASQGPKDWTNMVRHPYRTASAYAFIKACHIR